MTATDLDLDALIDALQSRALERAAAGPLRNVAGDVVTPYASTGRLVVNPGDIIASVWGNTTFDQTVQAYDNPAARDSQWPTPKDGAAAYTADTGTLWVRRAGAWHAVPAGVVGSATGPPSQTDCGATAVTLASIAFNAVAGRWYRFTATIAASQITATGTNSLVRMFDPAGGWWAAAFAYSLPTGSSLYGTGSNIWQATASGSVTSYIAGSTAAGALRFVANACRFYVEDIGS